MSHRKVLEEIGSDDDGSSDDATALGVRRRPWELRLEIQAAFKRSVEESRTKEHPEPWLSRLQDVGIHDSMEGAIEMRLDESVSTATAAVRMMWNSDTSW